MARVIMTCGKICCGKSTYARKIQKERNAVVLSIDEIALTLFPDGTGEMHNTYVLLYYFWCKIKSFMYRGDICT